VEYCTDNLACKEKACRQSGKLGSKSILKHISRLRQLGFTFALMLPSAAALAVTQLVPAWRCNADVLISSSFEDETSVRASLGSGGAFPLQSQITIGSTSGAVTYHYDVPAGYSPERPAPLMILLHGAAGPGGQPVAAASVRDAWAQAGLGDLIVVAQESSGSMGGWIPSADLTKLRAVLASARTRYNVDLNRIYGWGFSAGAHLMHGIALAPTGAPELFAGYGISAGALQAFVGITAPQNAPRKVPLHIHQGVDDGVVPLNIVQADVVRFQSAGWISEFGPSQNLYFETFNGGHEFENTHAQRIWIDLCRFAEVANQPMAR